MLTRSPFGSEETKRRKEKNERSIRNKQEWKKKNSHKGKISKRKEEGEDRFLGRA